MPIKEWCAKNKIQFTAIRGEIKDRDAQYFKFIQDPAVRVMIAHPACASESLDLTASSVMIFYSNGQKFREKQQAMGRILRSGQTKKCVFIDLVLENSIDEIVVANIQDIGKLSERVLVYIRKYHGKRQQNKTLERS